METPTQVLHLEDNLNDAELLHATLEAAGLPCQIVRVETEDAFRKALEENSNFDLIISDLTLPSFDGKRALAIAKQRRPDVPFIFVSGTIGEEAAIESLLGGATDYVLKHKFARLVPAVQRALHEAGERKARREAEQALSASEASYRLLFDNNPRPMWVYDTTTLSFLAVNDAAIEKYGYSREEFFRMTIKDIRPPEDVEALMDNLANVLKMLENSGNVRHRQKDGSVIEVEIASHELSFEGKQARLVMANDVTEKKELESQLRQSQKLEGVGQLAGGIAHDFNNLLTVILGRSQMLQKKLERASPLQRDVDLIHKTAERAASLTRQLLAFSRKQLLQPKVLDLNTVVADMDKMLQRVIGEHIELATVLHPGLGRIKVDPGQMEQVIMNLAVNARDAMPQGGKLMIETANVVLDQNYTRQHMSVQPGRYVMLAVTDAGCGMDSQTQARIFEPFFTTKEPGKGTGLGLFTVYGIVKQSGGNVWVYSEAGRGSTFKIYLPHVDDAADELSAIQESDREVKGSETILLVEDEETVRELSQEILQEEGYQVLVASNGKEAIQLCQDYNGSIDLVVTDVVMPKMSGPELVRQLSSLRPAAKTLFLSGYTNASITHNEVLSPEVEFLQKPFSAEAFARKVRQILDAAVGPHNP